MRDLCVCVWCLGMIYIEVPAWVLSDIMNDQCVNRHCQCGMVKM